MNALPQPSGLAWWQLAPWPRAAAAVLLSWGLLLWLYRQTAWSMVEIWLRSDTFAHGFLVLPIVLWLLWRQRQCLAALQPHSVAAWLPLAALCSLFWLIGELAAVHALSQGAMLALLVLAVALLLGREATRQMAFALAFLFFAVPLGEFLLPPLMDWTANVTTFALRASGIPVLRTGNRFVIPSGSWSVVEACSGVRYLIASFMLGTLFAYLNYRSLPRRLLFVALALLLPVLANWVRAYFIVLLGHLSGNRLATGMDHLLYGWLFFGLLIGLMFVLGARWAESAAPLAPAPRSARQADGAASAARRWPAPALAPVDAALWPSAAALLLIATLPHLLLWALDRQAQAGTAQTSAGATLAGPQLGPHWPLLVGAAAAATGLADTGAVLPGPAAPGKAGSRPPAWTPAYHQPTRVWQGQYGAAGRRVGLYVAIYLQQARGRSLVGSGNALLSSADPHWAQVGHSRQALQLGGQTVTLRRTALRTAERLQGGEPATLQVWQLYWVRGHVTASDAMAKAYSAYARLRGHSDDAAVLLAYAPDDATASAALEAFWRDNYATLQAWLTQQELP
jgi:exosortase A